LKWANEEKNTPPIILFFDETMRDRVKANENRRLGSHRFVIVLSSKWNDDQN
jgi:hypothetical protein